MKAVLCLSLAMSLALFCLMGLDKSKARRGKRRISEKCLFAFALLLGAPGGFLGMHAFHHKTRHWYFRIGFPLIAALQIAAFVYLFI